MKLWAAALVLALPGKALALSLSFQSMPNGASFNLEPGADGSSGAVQMLVLLSVLALLPLGLMLCSAFTRIIVVLSLLRQAMGLQQVPPTPVLVGLALFLTGFVMAPTFSSINESALKPLNQGKIQLSEALRRVEPPLRDFMLRQVREQDLATMAAAAMRTAPGSVKDVPTYVLAPAFLLSELRIAFKIGFLIYLPFLVVDMMVASVLNSMGMMMLPPMLFSAPLKLLLFILVDGWGLLTQQLIHSFR
jgi:flagellar biosynthetic protein FliP